MTRAMRNLTMTYANWRDVRGIIQRTSQSEFLSELPADQICRLTVGREGEINDDDEGEAEDEDEVQTTPGNFQQWRQGQLVRHRNFGLVGYYGSGRSPRGRMRSSFQRLWGKDAGFGVC